ncbi:MAG: alpha/beta hydrolase [bacterium]
MKNAIILHGTGDSPESFWYPYVKRGLEHRGYSVWIPRLPQSDKPKLELQLPFLLQDGEFMDKTVLIGHSAGVPLALSVLQKLQKKIKQAILVAGFVTPLEEGDGGPNLILQDQYDWERISKHVQDIFFIHSDNDPWGCGDVQGQYMFDHLGGTLIIRHGEGHMGSQKFNQTYKKFPFLLKIIA